MAKPSQTSLEPWEMEWDTSGLSPEPSLEPWEMEWDVSGLPPEPSPTDMFLGSPPIRALSGAARTAVLGPFRLGAEVGEKIRQKLPIPQYEGSTTLPQALDKFSSDWRERERRGMEAQEFNFPFIPSGVSEEDRDKYNLTFRTGGKGPNIAGMVGEMAPIASMFSKIPYPESGLGKGLQNILAGGFVSGMAPVDPTTHPDYLKHKGTQFLWGTGAGLFPPVVHSAKWLANALRDYSSGFRSGGYKDLAGRQLMEVIKKGKGSVKDMVTAIRNYRPRVPGRQPTTGEALASQNIPEVVGVQKGAETRISGPFTKRAAEQTEAERAYIGKIAGTPDKLNALKTQRKADAAINYKKAAEVSIKPDDELIEIMNNPFYKMAVKEANKLAKAEGITAANNLTQYLHFVKISLDDALESVGTNALSRTQKGATAEIKKRLVSWLENKNPLYADARNIFANQSQAISRMEVGQALDKTLTPKSQPLVTVGKPKDDLRLKPPTSTEFTKAVGDQDKLIRDATQYKTGGKQTLDDILAGDMDIVEGIAADLARRESYEYLADKGLPEALRTLSNAEAAGLPKILERSVVVINEMLSNVFGSIKGRTLEEIAEIMLNPKSFAEIMEKTSAADMEFLFKFVDEVGRFAITSMAPVILPTYEGMSDESPETSLKP